jgi:hypothetical protein
MSGVIAPDDSWANPGNSNASRIILHLPFLLPIPDIEYQAQQETNKKDQSRQMLNQIRGKFLPVISKSRKWIYDLDES